MPATLATNNLLIEQEPKRPKHWRSMGWKPLAYPRSAIVLCPRDDATIGPEEKDEPSTNPFFPLDRYVLLAALRELLILDGTLDAKTLRLSRQQLSSARSISPTAGLSFLSHMKPDIFQRIGSSNQPLSRDDMETRKRHNIHESMRSNKKFRTSAGTPLDVAKDTKLPSAEELCNTILYRCLRTSNFQQDGMDEMGNLDHALQRPRAVSDADSATETSNQVTFAEDDCMSELDLSHFLDFSGSRGNRSVSFSPEIPPMVNTSIATEQTLRQLAREIVERLVLSFDDEHIRLFLGYRACSMKRDRLLHTLSNYLFDVSHAAFAWKQTEHEIRSERWKIGQAKLRNMIKSSLFDERALKKIGGFEDACLLPQALGIERLALGQKPWEKFARTKEAGRALKYHREGKPFLIGQKRRANASKSLVLDSETEGRSRSSSIASAADDGTSVDETVPSIVADESGTEVDRCFSDLSATLQLSVKRKQLAPWGIKLSREGDLCLVDRAPEGHALQKGDMVLSVRDEVGETISPPIGKKARERKEEWFGSMVQMFKRSHKLELTIRRL